MFNKRWDYWLHTMYDGKVLDEPIPQTQWLGFPNDEARKNIEDCLNYSSSRMGSGTFGNFIDWLLYGFGDPNVKEFPNRIDPETNSFWYKTFNLGLLLKFPHDYLGQLAADKQGRGRWSNPTAFFPTPMHVCDLMTKMTMQDSDKTSSVMDPCVGSGRFLMTASNYSLNLYGMDIDYQILKVCKANMFMYVPWALARPDLEGLESVKAIEHGDALEVQSPIQKVTPEVQQEILKKGGKKQMDLFE